jgi:hypothetical protein
MEPIKHGRPLQASSDGKRPPIQLKLLCEVYRAAPFVKHIALNFATTCCKITLTVQDILSTEKRAKFDQLHSQIDSLASI